jgi:DNA uptake protein ComE-like DNA-binding protein
MNRQRRIQRGNNWLGRMLDAAQRRFRRARPGSVLVMVVALLVMLALIGTAAMSTARIDRISSVQHVANTEIDMLAESVKQMVIGQLVNDLFITGSPNTTDSAALDPDSPTNLRDAILGSRLPERLWVPTANLSLPANQQTIDQPTTPDPIWRSISYPVMQTGNPFRYDPPNEDSSSSPKYALPLIKPVMQPTFTDVNGEKMPALVALNLDGTPMSRPPGVATPEFLAADADGDGIADAILFKLPVSPIGGITYYGAVRVLDNNSAINLNTAWDPNNEGTTVRNASGTNIPINVAGMFPGSTGLTNDQLNFIIDRVDFQRFHAQRLFGTWKKFGLIPPPQAPGNAMPPAALAAMLTAPQPMGQVGQAAVPRTDFSWLTAGDVLHHELGRRLDNPWYWDNNATSWFGNGVRPFGIDAAMAMAYRFTLVNSASSDSLVETVLRQSIVNNYGAGTSGGNYQPYTFQLGDMPKTINSAPWRWFIQNFDYPPYSVPPAPPTALPNYTPNVRALLTSLNPIRHDAVRHTQLFGNATLPNDPFHFPTKANINTASFEELFQNFYDVMTDTGNSTPFDDDAGYQLSKRDPYAGMKFRQGGNFDNIREQHPARMFRSVVRGIGPAASHQTLLVDSANNPDAMHPYQVLQMRAAIAALNAKSLREADFPGVKVPHQKITLQPVALPGGGTSLQFKTVHLYGIKRQPFITEVYLNNNPEDQPRSAAATDPPPDPAVQRRNHRGFAAIELHNPYDVPLDLLGWTIKVIDRKNDITMPNAAAPGLRPIILGNNTTNTGPLGTQVPLAVQAAATPFTFGGAGNSGPTVIPAHGFMIIWNYNGNTQNAADFDTAQYLPSGIPTPGAGTTVVYLKTLHNIIGKEVVLMRPSDEPPLATDPPGPNVKAPVDSFDSTSMLKYEYAPGQPQLSVNAWHYVRANDPASGTQTATRVTPGRAWNFVYPGRYDASDVDIKSHQGTAAETWNPDPSMDNETWSTTPPTPPIKLGQSDDLNGRELSQRPSFSVGGTGAPPPPPVTSSFAIQIANSNPEQQLFTGAQPAFPFKGFARAGDIMQVPFIGSYTIEEDTPDTLTIPGVNIPVYYEINALPMDAAFAEDTDVFDDVDTTTGFQVEEIGRFVPLLEELKARRAAGTVQSVQGTDTIKDSTRQEKDKYWNTYDLVVTSSNPSANPKQQTRTVIDYQQSAGTLKVDVPFTVAPASGDSYVLRYYRYGFATKLFDYFTTINCPADDYLPNADPALYSPAPEPIKNADPTRSVNRTGLTPPSGQPVTQTEDNIGVEGLINVNTASWKVLASLPLVMTPDGTAVDQGRTEQLAKRIVYFRDVDDGLGIPPVTGPIPAHPHGPLRSVFELNILDQFADAEGRIIFSVNSSEDSGVAYGDFSPLTDPTNASSAKDNVRVDFEEKYMNLTRLSNLLTTRSDSFTAYIQVQGWRDAGTTNAKLVAQRRLAFIVDRSRVTAVKKTPAVYNVPTAN